MNSKIKFIIPFLILILIFSLASTCNSGSNPSNASETVGEEVEEAAVVEETTAGNGKLLVENKILRGNNYFI